MVLYSTTFLYKIVDQKILTMKIEKVVMNTDAALYGLLSILWYNEGKQNWSQQMNENR